MREGRWPVAELSINHLRIATLLPIRTLSEMNQGGRLRTKLKRKSEQKLVTVGLLNPFKPYLRLPATVRMTRQAPSNGLDDDNLRSALKYVRDSIAYILGVDDRDPRVRWEYDQGRAKEYGVWVEITHTAREQRP